MYSFSKKITQKGFSLIELMIAMALGVVVITGVTQSLTAILNSSRIQTASNDMQETADIALSYISREIRNSLSSPCQQFRLLNINQSLIVQPVTGTVDGESIDANDDIPGLVTGLGIRVTAKGLNKSLGNINNPSTDDLTMITAGDRLLITGQVLKGTSSVNLEGHFSDKFSNDSLYAITDCQHLDIFRATRTKPSSTNPNTTLTFSSNTNITRAYRDYNSAMISPVDVKELLINENTELVNKTIFKRSGGPLISNIELVRILFGVDSSGTDGIIDRYITARQLNDLNNSDAIISMELSIMVRSSDTTPNPSVPDYTLQMPNTATSDMTTDIAMQNFNFTDHVLRKVFTRSVTLRNTAAL